MRYYIIAGERSGDMDGGALIQNLKRKDLQANFRFWGGSYMETASGQKCIVHYGELAVIGLDFLTRIVKLFKFLNFCKKDLITYQPDAVILIDYSGFNLLIAKYAQQQHIRALSRSFNILRARLDRFGASQPNIQQLVGTGRIQIELPGITNPERIRKFLQGVAQLKFWEVGTLQEFDNHLQTVNNLLIEEQKIKEKSVITTTSAATTGVSSVDDATTK